jgi:tetratricopeptide (TPR) repeat protein
MTLEQQLESALSHHRAGRLAEAERIYRQILTQQPNHADALHLLGVLAGQTGRLDAGVELIRRAIAICSNNASYYSNLGNALTDMGQLDEAIRACRQAIRLQPDDAVAHNNLGIALRNTGQFEKAVASYREAIRLNPDYLQAHNNLGVALKDTGRLDEAIACYRQAIRIDPRYAVAHSNLGNALNEMGQLDEAIAAYRHAIRLNPDLAEVHSNLGNALKDKERFDEAIASYRQAVRLKPGFAEAHSNLGNALKRMGQLDEAIASYREAIKLKADFVQAHWNYAWVLLMLGEFEEGWKEFEWRLRMPQWTRLGRDFSQARWTGQDARGKTILLISDARFGDAMHLIRYAPLVAERGATVLLECQAELAPLLSRVHGISAVFVRGERLPAFDWQTPLLSLPLVFGTTMKTIPANVPYLSAPPDRIARWAKRLAGDSSFKVGLVWAGSAGQDARSCPLATFAPLAAIPGVAFYGLQKGPESNQPVPPDLRLIQMGDELHDFADTAALVSNLDLVISVDTSIVHLAGGLGRSVWTLISFNPGFQWLRDRTDSPWYPTMRLFRQPSAEDWHSVIARVIEALSLWIKNRA